MNIQLNCIGGNPWRRWCAINHTICRCIRWFGRAAIPALAFFFVKKAIQRINILYTPLTHHMIPCKKWWNINYDLDNPMIFASGAKTISKNCIVLRSIKLWYQKKNEICCEQTIKSMQVAHKTKCWEKQTKQTQNSQLQMGHEKTTMENEKQYDCEAHMILCSTTHHQIYCVW